MAVTDAVGEADVVVSTEGRGATADKEEDML